MKEKQFICKECKREFKRLCDLSKHVGVFHGSQKDYYDKYLKQPNEDICAECGNETKYSNGWGGYNKYCSQDCENKGSQKEAEKTNLRKYGVKNLNNLKTVRDKIKQTNIEKFGNACPMQNNKIQKEIRKKNLKNLGVELPFQSQKIQEKSALTREEKYGAKYTWQSKELMEKIKQTCNERYGVDYPIQSKEIQKKIIETNINKFGVDWQITSELTKEKIKKVMLEKYGVENCMQNKEIQEKFKNTMIKRYGFPYSMQNNNSFEKAFKTKIKLKKFKDTDLYYQGSYELDFLEKYYNKYPNITRAPSINYSYKRKRKVYHPDFLIPSKNLIVEVKNSYLAKRDKYKLYKKKKASEKEGFKWIMIVDKDYSKFEKLS